MSKRAVREGVTVWLDLETTGLDPREDHILELGMVVETVGLNGVDDFRTASWTIAPSEREWWSRMDEYVRAMHKGLRLLEDVSVFGAHVSVAEHDALEILEPLAEGGLLRLAGASVHFDAEFLRRWMPRLHAAFSHVFLDVSAIEAGLAPLGYRKVKREPAHRALSDCWEARDRYKEAAAWVRGLRREGFDVAREHARARLYYTDVGDSYADISWSDAEAALQKRIKEGT